MKILTNEAAKSGGQGSAGAVTMKARRTRSKKHRIHIEGKKCAKVPFEGFRLGDQWRARVSVDGWEAGETREILGWYESKEELVVYCPGRSIHRNLREGKIYEGEEVLLKRLPIQIDQIPVNVYPSEFELAKVRVIDLFAYAEVIDMNEAQLKLAL